MTLGGVADGATLLAWFGRAPTLPYQTLDTAWAEPPAQRANRKGSNKEDSHATGSCDDD